MEIVWDEPKRLANIAKHGLDFARLDETFFEQAIVAPAHSGRFKAIAAIGDMKVAVVFSFLGSEAVAVVSMRPASRLERSGHENKSRKNPADH